MSEEDVSHDEIHNITPETLEANQRWIKLMNEESERHRKTRDPRLYRESSTKKLITPNFLVRR